MQILSQLTLTEDDILISFDVESLFTKIPIHDMLEIVQEHITAADLPQDLSNLIELVSTPPSLYTRGNSTEKSKGLPWDLYYPLC
jgi:hypothetical protein